MLTYQDFLKVGESDTDKMKFVRKAIQEHKSTSLYKTAAEAEMYKKQQNTTIINYQKLLYTIEGRAVADHFSSNYKMATGKFKRFVTQEVQYLLGNGASFGQTETADKLGTKKKNFDRALQEVADKAITHAVAFGFWNLDHVEVFSVLEFVPLYDEDNGSMMAGIRFWQIAPDKPLRATLYEIDGYTEYIWRKSKGEVYQEKRTYIVKYVESPADGREIYDGENYPTFPIVPMWGCPEKQSKLVGLREQIDCYDLIKSGYANNVDEASMIYWTIKNAGGMDDVDLAQFLERMRTVHAATMDDDAEAVPNSINVPVEAREKLLDRLERDLYRDARALDVERIASGAVTATQILAAYNDINSLCDEFEYCVLDFVYGIMDVAGIDDEVTFTRSQIINVSELITTMVSAATFLPGDYVTAKILSILGDADKTEDVLRQMAAEEQYVSNPPTEEPTAEEPEGELNE